ncbi:MAG: hypothetical protein JWO30_1162 [Fibrobacteres bacterium]|nr:hypothetical protein [Fibrobacterota bacterium]
MRTGSDPTAETKDLSPIQQINGYINQARSHGLIQLVDQGSQHNGHSVVVNGQELINFGSCGYMGLEFDPRVREGGIEAIRNYGIQFSSSRSYLSNPMYPKLEGLLENIFQSPTLLASTTTLAHLAALPTLVSPDDVVLMDQQVHSSVQMASKVLKANGVQIEIISHSNVARIERKIKAFKDTKKKIWYLGDGVYSMYGDFAPVAELEHLLNTYEQFHLYLDDAHGMSWMGKRGCGYVLDNMKKHERLYVLTGLAKGFGTGGGAMILPNNEVKQLIRNCGGTQIFSGPIQPPLLGAGIESAKIHLRDDFESLQHELRDKMAFMTKALDNQPLPQMSAVNSPIRFLGIGPTGKAQEIAKILIKKGFWLNVAHFPAVGPHHSGLRFMVNRQTRETDIENFVDAIKSAAYDIIGKDEEAISQIWKTFSKEYRYSLIQG